ncbi:MAG: hypothetical protein ACRC7R_07740 [Sarcina sp.]
MRDRSDISRKAFESKFQEKYEETITKTNVAKAKELDKKVLNEEKKEEENYVDKKH